MPLFLKFKTNTMNEQARKLFNNLMEANWQIEQNKNNKDLVNILLIAYHHLRAELIEEIGAAEYNKFMKLGAQMFA
jgi:hypothetical protein